MVPGITTTLLRQDGSSSLGDCCLQQPTDTDGVSCSGKVRPRSLAYDYDYFPSVTDSQIIFILYFYFLQFTKIQLPLILCCLPFFLFISFPVNFLVFVTFFLSCKPTVFPQLFLPPFSHFHPLPLPCLSSALLPCHSPALLLCLSLTILRQQSSSFVPLSFLGRHLPRRTSLSHLLLPV